jgi:hypothetical protein
MTELLGARPRFNAVGALGELSPALRAAQGPAATALRSR